MPRFAADGSAMKSLVTATLPMLLQPLPGDALQQQNKIIALGDMLGKFQHFCLEEVRRCV